MTNPSAGSNAHWRDEDLLTRIYGLDPEPPDQLHALESCPECLARFEALVARRQQVVSGGIVSDDFLRAQRQAILSKIEDRRRGVWTSWKVPVAATALVVMMGVLLQRPAPQPVVDPAPAVSDAQFFSEIATLASSDEPRAADPIKGLFTEHE
jgi:hypothetical protein